MVRRRFLIALAIYSLAHIYMWWRLVLPRDGGSPTEGLDFDLHEVREARLVPQLDFKGRRARPAAA